MVLDITPGQMADDTQDSGLTTKCMEQANLCGRMDLLITVTILMTKNMAKGNSIGQMGTYTMAFGSTAFNTVEGY